MYSVFHSDSASASRVSTGRGLLLASVLLVGACGGGSGGSSSASNPTAGTPPTKRQDGSPLDDRAGYRVYYGTSYVSLPFSRIGIGNSSAVTVIDSAGRESSFSRIVSVTFP